MRNFLLLFCCFLGAVSIVGCSKDEEPMPEAQAPFIRMQINGKWWLAENIDMKQNLFFRKSEYSEYYFVNIEGNSTNNFDDFFYRFDATIGLEKAYIPKVGDTHTAGKGMSLNFVHKNAGGCVIMPSFSNYNGELPFKFTITEVIPDGEIGKYYVPGKFEGKMKNDEGYQITISNGEFKCKVDKQDLLLQ